MRPERLDAKIGEDLIIILPNNTTGNVANNKGAIEEKLRKLIDPINNPTFLKQQVKLSKLKEKKLILKKQMMLLTL